MDDFRIDARRWRFLDRPARYISHKSGGLKVEPLARQFATAKDILSRFTLGRGVLLADDVGLGKTIIAALVAWIVACQGKRVRIYAPNDVLRRRWAKELERHVPMLKRVNIDASNERIKQVGRAGGNGTDSDVQRLHAGRILVTTHHALVKSYESNQQRTSCDLMIIDEAHRAKGDGSAFNEALKEIGHRAKRKLILTATPFSIRIAELKQLLCFVGATDQELRGIQSYAEKLKRLHSLSDGHDVAEESDQLVSAARSAIKDLQSYLIRYSVEDLPEEERQHFGSVSKNHWNISTVPASPNDISLLLRVDRLLQLTSDRPGERRNDPRLHVGWRHVDTVLKQAEQRISLSNFVAAKHLRAATSALKAKRSAFHPKVAAVDSAIRPVVEAGEKVLVFCHHRATASELLQVLEKSLKADRKLRVATTESVWRGAWTELLSTGHPLEEPIIEWLCSPGLRAQVAGWLGEPAGIVSALSEQLRSIRPRHATSGAPTIFETATALRDTLLDPQSNSTLALLRAIAGGRRSFGGALSHFPGRLDDGFRAMGAWDHDGHLEPPKTLYTGKPDIVLAVFNSPFGPDVLVATDRLSEGVDLHRCCRHLIHYELDPSPVRTLQRNGRVRRVGSWSSLTGRPILYAYPSFDGTRDEKAVQIMKKRVDAFGLLLGGVPSLTDEAAEDSEDFAQAVLGAARDRLETLNQRLHQNVGVSEKGASN